MMFDAHSDTFTDVTLRILNGETDIFRKYHLDLFKKGNVDSSVFVIWIDPPFTNEAPKRVVQIVDCLQKEIAAAKDIIRIVHKYSDFALAHEEGKIAIVIGMEGLSHIGSDVDRLDYFYNEVGARHASLTWNEENELATGALGTPERGLTIYGKNAVKKMEELGMVVDVSHLNEKSFWDLVGVATKPIIASHSNARALCDAKRNLYDEQIIEIAKTGGVIGMNSFKEFVDIEVSKQDVHTLVNHIDYIADKVGIEHIGFGFDFSGYLGGDTLASFTKDTAAPGVVGLDSPVDIVNVLDELRKRGYTKEQINMISSENFDRVFKQILK